MILPNETPMLLWSCFKLLYAFSGGFSEELLWINFVENRTRMY